MSPTSRRAVGVHKLLFVSECAVLKELHVLQQRMNVCSCTESLYSVCGAAALKILLTGSRVLCIREMKLFRKFIFNVCFLEIKNLLWAIFKGGQFNSRLERGMELGKMQF